jgi:predicted nucleotidyltransferase
MAMSGRESTVQVTPALMKTIVRRIVDAIHPIKVVMFGSRARGQTRPTSDLDLLIVAESREPRHRRAIPIYGALSDILLPMDIVVYTPDEAADWSEVRQALVTTALREGKVLYEKHR